jgi:hypothetical protein
MAKNIILIMNSIEEMLKQALESYSKNNVLPTISLIYFYCKIISVLDALNLNSIKNKYITVAGWSQQINMFDAIEILAKTPSLSNVEEMKSTVYGILPNAKKVYLNFADNIIPIESRAGVVGYATIVYSILKEKIPVGIGIEPSNVHYQFFMDQLLYLLDHDYQHAVDINSKSRYAENIEIKKVLDEIFNQIRVKLRTSSDLSKDEINEVKRDIFVLFYCLHENPFLHKLTNSYLTVPGIYNQYQFQEGQTEKEFKKIAKHRIGEYLFDIIDYIKAFNEVYPEEFSKELEKNTIIKISGNKVKIPVAIFDTTEVTKTESLVKQYIYKTLSDFSVKYDDIIKKQPLAEKKIDMDLKDLYDKAIKPYVSNHKYY